MRSYVVFPACMCLRTPACRPLTMRWCAQVTGDENIPAGRVSFMAAATDVMLGRYDGREEVVGGLMMIRPICASTLLPVCSAVRTGLRTTMALGVCLGKPCTCAD